MMKNIKKKLKNRKGFTLVELIIVIAILGILVAIAVPRFSAAQANAKARADIANAKSMSNMTAALMADNTIEIPSAETTLIINDTTAATATDAEDIEAALQNIPTVRSPGHGDDAWFRVVIATDGNIVIEDEAERQIYPRPVAPYNR